MSAIAPYEQQALQTMKELGVPASFLNERRQVLHGECDDLVSIGYHSDTRCPLKESLLPPEAEARQIVAEFGAEAFPSVRVEVTHESIVEKFRRRAINTAWTFLSNVKKTIVPKRETTNAE